MFRSFDFSMVRDDGKSSRNWGQVRDLSATIFFPNTKTHNWIISEKYWKFVIINSQNDLFTNTHQASFIGSLLGLIIFESLSSLFSYNNKYFMLDSIKLFTSFISTVIVAEKSGVNWVENEQQVSRRWGFVMDDIKIKRYRWLHSGGGWGWLVPAQGNFSR